MTFPGAGVSSFTVSGINPTVDGTNPIAFPVEVTLNQPDAVVEAFAFNSPPTVLPSQVATTASGLAYSRVSQTFNGTVTITNISSSAVSGPLQILFTTLPANVTLANATGSVSGAPYLSVPAAAVSLTAGQSTTVSVQFKNPSGVTINSTQVIYSGSLN